MRPLRRLESALHRIAALAVLLPFLALSLLPAGTMPTHTADGRLVLVLCTGDGPQEVVVDLGPGEAGTTQMGCPWALAGTAAILPDAPSAPAAPLRLAALWPGVAAGHLVALPPAEVPAAGGPPLSA